VEGEKIGSGHSGDFPGARISTRRRPRGGGRVSYPIWSQERDRGVKMVWGAGEGDSCTEGGKSPIKHSYHKPKKIVQLLGGPGTNLGGRCREARIQAEIEGEEKMGGRVLFCGGGQKQFKRPLEWLGGENNYGGSGKNLREATLGMESEKA